MIMHSVLQSWLFSSLRLFFLPPPTSDELQFFSVTSSFTRLIIKTKCVCHGLISLYVNFHNNRTMWSTNLLVKTCRWGGKGKRAQLATPLVKLQNKAVQKLFSGQLVCWKCCRNLFNAVFKSNAKLNRFSYKKFQKKSKTPTAKNPRLFHTENVHYIIFANTH